MLRLLLDRRLRWSHRNIPTLHRDLVDFINGLLQGTVRSFFKRVMHTTLVRPMLVINEGSHVVGQKITHFMHVLDKLLLLSFHIVLQLLEPTLNLSREAFVHVLHQFFDGTELNHHFLLIEGDIVAFLDRSRRFEVELSAIICCVAHYRSHKALQIVNA